MPVIWPTIHRTSPVSCCPPACRWDDVIGPDTDVKAPRFLQRLTDWYEEDEKLVKKLVRMEGWTLWVVHSAASNLACCALALASHTLQRRYDEALQDRGLLPEAISKQASSDPSTKYSPVFLLHVLMPIIGRGGDDH